MAKVLSASRGEFSLSALLALVPWALSARGVAVNAWLAAALFLASFGLLCDLVVRAPWARRWKIASIVATATVLASVWVATSTPAITVDPEGEFVLSSTEWSEKTSVLVTNQRSVPLYSVRVKVWTETPLVLSGDIIVEMDSSPVAPRLRVRDQEISPDSWTMGYRDKDNREAVCIAFHGLLPHQSRRFTVYGKPNSHGTARIRVLGYSLKPEPLRENATKVRMQMEVCEAGKLTDIRNLPILPGVRQSR